MPGKQIDQNSELFLNTLIVANHNDLSYLILTISSCNQPYFQDEIAPLDAEVQIALTNLRTLYLKALSTDATSANQIKSQIKSFIHLDQNAKEKMESYNGRTEEIKQAMNEQFFITRINREQHSFFSKHKKDVTGLSADELNNAGWYYYQHELYERAVAYFQKAALLMQEEALLNLGACYHWAKGVEQDDSAAILCYELAAKKNNPKAFYNLGIACQEGWYDGTHNYSKALTFFLKAASLEDGEATCELGLFAEHGHGSVIKNYQNAYRKYANADALDCARGTYHLGRCYERGNGVAVNLGKALDCYQRAETLGHQRATEAKNNILEKQRVSYTQVSSKR